MLKPLYCCDEYMVDSEGFVISKKYGVPMKPSISHSGYYLVNLSIYGISKTIPVHLAVARTFLGDRTKEGMQVNHIDGNKLNNCLSNLEWVTPKENTLHSIYILGNNVGSNNGNSKGVLGYDKINNELKYSYDSIADCARDLCEENQNYRYIQGNIWRALKGIRKTYRGCYWRYKD